MIVERTEKEIVIRISSSVNTDDLQDLLNLSRYKELTSKSTIYQSEIDDFSSEINKSWWQENKV